MNIHASTILVTGGGSGIGEALAHRLHDLGNHVIVTGRRADALERAVDGRERMAAMTLDVDDARAIEDFARRVVAEHPALNVLINNAGIMRQETLTARRDLGDAEATITTNLLGPIRLIDALVDHLVSVEDAAIVNNTSGLAFVPLVATPTYSATKAAMHSYTISLREALRGRGRGDRARPSGGADRADAGPGDPEGLPAARGVRRRGDFPAEPAADPA